MKLRDSNLELLRIISMILIVVHHYAVHGFFLKENFSILPITLNKIIILFLSLGGKIGVNCFVLISAYYLINREIDLKKIMKIIFMVIFYSGIILFSLYIFKYDYLLLGGINILLKESIKIILSPLIGYWFITCYILLYLSSPILNKIMKYSTKDELKFLILGMLFSFGIIKSIGINLFYSNYIWFICLYFISGYIKKYLSLEKINKDYIIITISFCYLCLILFIISLSKILKNKVPFSKILLFQIETYNIFIIVVSLSLFIYFLKFRIGRVKFINYIACSMLGVYLLHDNHLTRDFIWNKVYKNINFLNSKYLVLHIIFSTLSLFIICIIIDKVINYMFNKYIYNFIKKLIEIKKLNIDKLLKKLLLLTEKWEK